MYVRAAVEGSSPLTRGAPAGRLPAYQSAGLIPAHAGSTPRPTGEIVRSWAHPRSRGEHQPVHLYIELCEGSSPLTRGALGLYGAAPDGEGLIPAHAGSTSSSAAPTPTKAAHPRSRGEHSINRTRISCRSGSSPLTRGALHPAWPEALREGLIPAHAGSTC